MERFHRVRGLLELEPRWLLVKLARAGWNGTIGRTRATHNVQQWGVSVVAQFARRGTEGREVELVGLRAAGAWRALVSLAGAMTVRAPPRMGHSTNV